MTGMRQAGALLDNCDSEATAIRLLPSQDTGHRRARAEECHSYVFFEAFEDGAVIV